VAGKAMRSIFTRTIFVATTLTLWYAALLATEHSAVPVPNSVLIAPMVESTPTGVWGTYEPRLINTDDCDFFYYQPEVGAFLTVCPKLSWYQRPFARTASQLTWVFDSADLLKHDGYYEFQIESERGPKLTAAKFLTSSSVLESGSGTLSGVLFLFQKTGEEYYLTKRVFFDAPKLDSEDAALKSNEYLRGMELYDRVINHTE
jgi:hypothetical protein